MILSFSFFIILFLGIGILSSVKRQSTTLDYLLANKGVPPWLVALSAIATNNSGYMFVGQIGYTYVYGLSSIWLLLGWILGDLTASLLVHKKLRLQTDSQEMTSYGEIISNWYGDNFKQVRIVTGIVVLIFLSVYAAAQLKAGSKALHVLLGWHYDTGAYIGALVVLIYCWAGGIRASIWTDAAQSIVMIIAMSILCIAGIHSVGGIAELTTSLNTISNSYMNIFPEHILSGGGSLMLVGWIASWFFAGIGIIGMPHVMVRFMTLNDPEKMLRVRCYYYFYYLLFFCLTITVALIARIIIPTSELFDKELALPMLASLTMPDFFVGIILAGLFAATLSTADSLILSCTASLSRDIFRKYNFGYILTKITTIFVTLITLLITLYGGDSVFDLVLNAISVLGAAFAPILILYSFTIRPKEFQLLGMIATGIVATLLWRESTYGNYIFEIGPGIIAGLVSYPLLYGVEKILLTHK